MDSPLSLTIENGRIGDISGPKRHVSDLNALFKSHGDQKSRILAECGIGLNPEAKLRGIMLTDEGCLGTMHFGFARIVPSGRYECSSFSHRFRM